MQTNDHIREIRDAMRALCAQYSEDYWREYHIERKLRETRLYQIAPISTNLILSYISEHVLGMPRSF